jgi:hypothetical protein
VRTEGFEFAVFEVAFFGREAADADPWQFRIEESA